MLPLLASSYAALEEQARLRPDDDALVFPHEGRRTGFLALHDRVRHLARGLLLAGLAPGDHVALLAENRTAWVEAQLAVAGAGMVLVPLNTHYRQDDLAWVLRQSRARGLILSPSFRANPYLDHVQAVRASLPDLRLVVTIDPVPGFTGLDELVTLGERTVFALPEPVPGRPAAILYTSGTTGHPKGAVLDHRAMLMNARGTAARLDLRPGDRWTSMIPLFHCAGCIMNLLGCLQAGAAYVGVPSFDPAGLMATIQAERCTHLSGVPTAYVALLDAPARAGCDLGSLRAGTCGGADADPEILAACAREFPLPGLVQVYGQTESGTLVSCPAIDDPERWRTAGPPLPGYELRITDPATGLPVEPGAIGQIEARGPMTMQGYFERPEETAATLGADGWLRTGDLGRLDGDGRLIIAGGRIRDMIIRGGENIYPAEIEPLFRAHPAIDEVAVFGLPDRYYGEIVAAALRLRAPVDPTALRLLGEGRIARFKLPTRFFRVEAFPLTASGKIRKVELRQLAQDGRLVELT